ncbi:MAG: 30S ribosomal protein S12 methylthiotransferase RimO [Planctomycetes bacterium]|nr:30S ribosomal protein S12 methylthiotransferase RimO [Planctomycetota bacterium]
MQQDRRHAICWISLGCPKNLVDTERVLGRLVERGWLLCERPDDADIVIVNTCGFIQDAADESKQLLAQLGQLKKNGCAGIIAAGCLVERMGNALSSDVPEVDAFVGLADADEIEAACREIIRGRGRLFTRKPHAAHNDTGRLRITPRHYSYLQITDGCNNRCNYCVIPLIRGPLRSKPLAAVMEEARELLGDGAKELNVIGQDTTSYGKDAGGEDLPTLLSELCGLDVQWIRLLYTHPAHLTEAVIKVIAENDKIVNYVDIPIQHINDNILHRMNRIAGRKRIEDQIARLRAGIPGVILRTSVIVGLPGETHEAFEELLEFVGETRFERLGAFAYSREEGVPAYDFPAQVPEKTKQKRLGLIMRRQGKIAAETARAMIGKTVDVVVESKLKAKRSLWQGRTYGDAPDVDGIIYLSGKGLEPGMFAKATITGSRDYDLEGEILA